MLGGRAVAQPCVGDCNGDGVVAVSELITGVTIALQGAIGDPCPAMECNGPGLGIYLNCVVVAVNNALEGCDRSSVDAVWLFNVPCRQCEACQLSIDQLLRPISGDTIPPGLLPDGVTVLDSRIELVQAACSACGCPEPGSPIFHVLVPRSDVDRLLPLGWSVER
jgi:hypothetical protein